MDNRTLEKSNFLRGRIEVLKETLRAEKEIKIETRGFNTIPFNHIKLTPELEKSLEYGIFKIKQAINLSLYEELKKTEAEYAKL